MTKNNKRAVCGYLIAAALVLLTYWLWSGLGGNRLVDRKLDDIAVTVRENERRVEDVLDAAERKEAEVKRETQRLLETVSDDALPDLLAGLLADYRAGRH